MMQRTIERQTEQVAKMFSQREQELVAGAQTVFLGVAFFDSDPSYGVWDKSPAGQWEKVDYTVFHAVLKAAYEGRIDFGTVLDELRPGVNMEVQENRWSFLSRASERPMVLGVKLVYGSGADSRFVMWTLSQSLEDMSKGGRN